jgi:hypothetical protein
MTDEKTINIIKSAISTDCLLKDDLGLNKGNLNTYIKDFLDNHLDETLKHVQFEPITPEQQKVFDDLPWDEIAKGMIFSMKHSHSVREYIEKNKVHPDPEIHAQIVSELQNSKIAYTAPEPEYVNANSKCNACGKGEDEMYHGIKAYALGNPGETEYFILCRDCLKKHKAKTYNEQIGNFWRIK